MESNWLIVKRYSEVSTKNILTNLNNARQTKLQKIFIYREKKKGKHGRGPSSASTLFAFVRFYVN